MKATIVVAMAILTLCAADAYADRFGTGANSFTIDFVDIGNPGNVADTTGKPNPAGAVPYDYRIGKYEISRGIIGAANAEAGLGLSLADMSSYGGNGPDQPATGVSWFGLAKFVNWLNTSTGHAAAYKFDLQGVFQVWAPGDPGYNSANQYRNTLAKYVLPSNDEWYKAAFYNAATGTYFDYATGSNNAPTPTSGGTAAGTAVYAMPPQGAAEYFLAGGLSPYGTMGQSGNVHEWMESMWSSPFSQPANDDPFGYRVIRGGDFSTAQFLVNWLAANPSGLGSGPPDFSYAFTGFRVVSLVPEPSSGLCLAIGAMAVISARRTRARHRSIA
jgi:formylglycine-generating enzyme